MKRKYRKILFLLSVLLIIKNYSLHAQNNTYDIVIVGGTPAGIMAAISSARQGKSSLILERTSHIGGLPANGLGATDIATRGATTGLFEEFVRSNKEYYIKNYGIESNQVIDCSDGYYFEPSVAEISFLQMIEKYDDKITIKTNRQFDANPLSVEKEEGSVKSILVLNRINNKIERYYAEVFIDATYEGDLGAASGIPYRVGRESQDEFGEIGAGKIYMYWNATSCKRVKATNNNRYESEGSTFAADNAIQAYNYRLCLTKDKSQQRKISKPKNYNRNEYKSLIDDVWTGRNTNVEMFDVTDEMLIKNKANIANGNPTNIPGDNWGIAKIVNIIPLPNNKTDANNQHSAFLSTDLPEENWAWPTAGWEWRDKFSERLKEYTLGLLWFVQNDKELPLHFREECKKWGLSTTEYIDNDNFPRLVYVREGRRLEGMHLFLAHDALPTSPGLRPPIYENSITSSHYPLDSHAVLKRENTRVHLDGFISYDTQPYTVPYGVMVPKEIKNVLFPVAVSGSHIGFSTLRMEPCWMALGEAAGIAASLAIDENVSVRDINIYSLQNILIDNNVTLFHYKDSDKIKEEDFKMTQLMGVKGYISNWEASLESEMDNETKQKWQQASGIEIPERYILRREALYYIFNRLYSAPL